MSLGWQLAKEITAGNLGAVQKLLSANDLLNKPIRECANATPLSYACLHGELQVVHELIRRNADLLTEDIDGRAPLHCGNSNATCMDMSP